MGMFEGKARVGKSMKELLMHWNETKQKWDNGTSRTFEQRFLIPMEGDSRNAVTAMENMAQILQQIKRDCE